MLAECASGYDPGNSSLEPKKVVRAADEDLGVVSTGIAIEMAHCFASSITYSRAWVSGCMGESRWTVISEV